jgi:phage terminase large subunit
MIDELIELDIELELEQRKRKSVALSNYESQKAFYRKNPLDYLVERLGYKRETMDWGSIPGYDLHKWDGTPNPLKTILDLLSSGERRIGVESATGTGKTKLGAGIALWFLDCFENSMVVTTAPKSEQLKLHIWKEIGKMYEQFGKGELTSLKLRMIPDRDDWLAVGFVAGTAADESSATKAQGFHAEHMLIILEETPGIPQPVITAFQNTADAPHNIILALGNPDHQLDALHTFCTLPNVKHIRISALDHPNVVLQDPSFIPGAATLDGVTDKKMRYGGEDGPLYLSRARGISPGQSSDALIKMQWCIDAYDEKNRSRSDLLLGEKALGVDVANSESGDKAAIAEGKGAVLLSVEDFQCPDSNQLGKRDIYLKIKTGGVKPEFIGVDSVGVGAGTVNALKELGYKVVALGGADSPTSHKGEEDFNNLRSQMYWQMREDLRLGNIILPRDEGLIADLTAPTFAIKNGKIVVESKDEIKKRLGRSPNRGDSAIYWNWVRKGNRTKSKLTASLIK